MNNGRALGLSLGLVLALAASLIASAAASANPILMPTLSNEIAQQKAIVAAHQAINPPAPPCPETGMLPEPFSNCGLPEAPATTLPYPGNMAYWGGHVQVAPKVYIVYFGWGEQGAFPAGEACTPEAIVEGALKARLKCDPQGAGKRMADFVSQMGATEWAKVSTQFFQSGAGGTQQHITNPSNVLGGIWVDDTNAGNLTGTSASSAPGASNTYTDLAAEAARAAKHFHVTDLADANFVIAQPRNFTDPNALASGYCAFHDYTQPNVEHGIYNGVTPNIAYTNMPYVLAVNSTPAAGGEPVNDCGENAVNSGAAGKLDGQSIVLGHEIEETITDPGAEEILGSGTSATNLGGWYDTVDANENGDKCAWVGEPLVGGLPGEPNVMPVPGAMGDIKGNRGTTFAVQSLWSNEAAGGAGFCAGAGTDLPA
jgi:serine protease